MNASCNCQSSSIILLNLPSWWDLHIPLVSLGGNSSPSLKHFYRDQIQTTTSFSSSSHKFSFTHCFLLKRGYHFPRILFHFLYMKSLRLIQSRNISRDGLQHRRKKYFGYWCIFPQFKKKKKSRKEKIKTQFKVAVNFFGVSSYWRFVFSF